MAKKKKNTVDSLIVRPAQGEELMSLVDTQEAAEKLAKDVGITLVTFAQGVATYTTNEDLQTVIMRGKDLGYNISINSINELINSKKGLNGFSFTISGS